VRACGKHRSPDKKDNQLNIMKTKLLVVTAALIGAAGLSAHAGGLFVSFRLPLPPLPPLPVVAVAAPAPVVVAPAPQVDVVATTPCPAPGYVWAPGYWSGHVWVAGCWHPGPSHVVVYRDHDYRDYGHYQHFDHDHFDGHHR
jgi:hypothetical protein